MHRISRIGQLTGDSLHFCGADLNGDLVRKSTHRSLLRRASSGLCSLWARGLRSSGVRGGGWPETGVCSLLVCIVLWQSKPSGCRTFHASRLRVQQRHDAYCRDDADCGGYRVAIRAVYDCHCFPAERETNSTHKIVRRYVMIGATAFRQSHFSRSAARAHELVVKKWPKSPCFAMSEPGQPSVRII